MIAGEEAGAGQDGHGLFPGVDQVGIFLALKWRRSDPQQAVLRLQNDLDSLRYIGRNRGGQADAEIDIKAVLQLPGDPPCASSLPFTLIPLPEFRSGQSLELTKLSLQKWYPPLQISTSPVT